MSMTEVDGRVLIVDLGFRLLTEDVESEWYEFRYLKTFE